MIVPPTALESCDMAIPRYQYFGYCPNAWARDISVKWHASKGKAKVTMEGTYSDEAYEEKTRVDELDVP